jgi:DNA-directed RNA polymerase subunit RPC12/RpoP
MRYAHETGMREGETHFDDIKCAIATALSTCGQELLAERDRLTAELAEARGKYRCPDCNRPIAAIDAARRGE